MWRRTVPSLKMHEKYQIQEQIGEGSFSQVFLCVRGSMKYAVKKLPRTQETQQKTTHEIRANCILKHKGLVRFFEYFEETEHLYLVFEHVQGITLWEMMNARRNIPLPEIAAKYIFKQLVKILVYLHGKSVFHRDLKLENIMVNHAGRVKLIDFGLCGIQKDSNLPFYDSVGSLAFGSPELLSGKGYLGGKNDVFSCGVILFAIVYGDLPFLEDDRKEFLKGNLGHPIIEFPTSPILSGEIIELIAQLLALEAKERIPLKKVRKHKWLKGKQGTFILHDLLGN